MTVYLWEWKCF